MPSMTVYSFGDVILVQFPFTDQTNKKQRPAVVISSSRYNEERPDLVIMAITSRIRSTLGYGERAVTDWRAAGLLKPSAIKPVVATIERSLVRKSLGRLSESDSNALTRSLDEIIARD